MDKEDVRREHIRDDARQAERDEQLLEECRHDAYEPRLEDETTVDPDGEEPPFIRVELTCSNCGLYHETVDLKPHPDEVPDGNMVDWDVGETIHGINEIVVESFTDIDATLVFYLVNHDEEREHMVVVPCHME